MKSLYLFLLMTLSISLFQSCQKETIDDGKEETAPTLPPEELFIMPFAGFEDADTTGLTSNDQLTSFGPNGEIGTYQSWFFAATNLVIWNSVITLNTIIPVASFREAFNHQGQIVSPGVFVWEYDHIIAGVTYSASLTGEILNPEEVKWTMVISQENGWQNVEWYSGIVKTDHSGASWTLNHKPNNPEAFLDITYNKNVSAGTFDIRYTNMIPGNPNNGDYIEFRAETGTGFNRAYDVSKENGTDLLEIEWNKPNNNGRVRNEKHFGDTEWHCWDTDLRGIDCM